MAQISEFLITFGVTLMLTGAIIVMFISARGGAPVSIVGFVLLVVGLTVSRKKSNNHEI